MIQVNYLSAEKDVAMMIECVKIAREIFNAKPFAEFLGKEIFPGAQVRTDAEILEFIRQKAETIYHPVSTCKMGTDNDEMAVVDPELKVRGIDNLRVVDASIMPTLLSGNTNAPTVMVAEKAVDMMKG
jgi:choline dehydrogenase-like flavoprotein